MERILITTDFSPASRHALDFTASLIQDRDVIIDLVHPFPVAVLATAEALALAALGSGIEQAESLMAAELGRIRAGWPSLQIKGRVIAGPFIETLRAEAALVAPRFIVLGTAGYGDLSIGESDPLEALRLLRAPVLFIPEGAAITPIRSVTYACNYSFAGPGRTPLQAISEWVSWMGATLEVVHVDGRAHGEDPQQLEGERWLRQALAPLRPGFRWITDPDLLQGLGAYLRESDTDCLMAVPRRYGFWEGIFHQSRTKALARFNRHPVVAIHEE